MAAAARESEYALTKNTPHLVWDVWWAFVEKCSCYSNTALYYNHFAMLVEDKNMVRTFRIIWIILGI